LTIARFRHQSVPESENFYRNPSTSNRCHRIQANQIPASFGWISTNTIGVWLNQPDSNHYSRNLVKPARSGQILAIQSESDRIRPDSDNNCRIQFFTVGDFFVQAKYAVKYFQKTSLFLKNHFSENGALVRRLATQGTLIGPL